jgi:hypothetical protein
MQTLIQAPSMQAIQFGASKRTEQKPNGITAKVVQDAFKKHNIKLTDAKAEAAVETVKIAVKHLQEKGKADSNLTLKCINIATAIGLDSDMAPVVLQNIQAAVTEIKNSPAAQTLIQPEWNAYFDKVVSLVNDTKFDQLARAQGFSPVTVSWEDISRTQNSSWGSRISDVCVYVRKDESDPTTAKRTFTVRRDQNFRDKILMVPAKNIKIHQKGKGKNGKVKEVSLPERLKQLGLTSKENDAQVIVSNQFTVVPVPSKDMKGAWKDGEPPRAAFNFTVQPYGSSNLVITDVMENSAEAVVDGSRHQLLFAKKDDGTKAPFTASRAEDRQDLLQKEAELKAAGLDVDVQRYYLIQIPLKKGTKAKAANMGNPPESRGYGYGDFLGGGPMLESFSLESISAPKTLSMTRSASRGLERVAIGVGESEGEYNTGSGFEGERAQDEPIRVTVSYFVTPKGEVTEKDMQAFVEKFKEWDKQAIWGGSLVTPGQ